MKKYNELFNSTRPREYDGSHIHFVGMNPEINLREHQRNAVAHVLYGYNTLLAHEVGAGKSFEMAASAMELKRLGLCQKSLFDGTMGQRVFTPVPQCKAAGYQQKRF